MIPVRARGRLREFAEAGVLDAADVHVALRLGRLGEEPDEVVQLAAALAVRALRGGSVCVELATAPHTVVPEAPGDEPDAAAEPLAWPEDWAALSGSSLVAVGAEAPWRPLRLVDGLLYLDRYWQQEQLVRRELTERAGSAFPPVDPVALARSFPEPGRQRLAAAVAVSRGVSVLTGGPGTGKTHTVARLLQLLLGQPGPPPRIALAAPTGKAAARLQESVQEQAAAAGLPPGLTASTVHRLLGWRPDSRSRFRHDGAHHLPYDVVVVDEASMVSLTLMARLLEALRPSARLVLVGDPDQLTSVEAGAVLSDLVHRPAPTTQGPVLPAEALAAVELDEEERRQLRNGVVRLTTSHRFGAELAALAGAVRNGDAELVLALLRGGGALSLCDGEDELREEVVRTGAELADAAGAGDAEGALALLGRHRLLCAHRHGAYGVSSWNELVGRWLGAPAGEWHPGQPLLVTANDHEAGLYNGDAGVVVQTPDGLQAAFGRGTGPALFPRSRLASVQTAHALTVHRSQGSQYDAVSVLLPGAASAVLTRELLYTAVTRARTRVRVLGSEDRVREAVGTRVVRASGLRRAPGTSAAAGTGSAGPPGPGEVSGAMPG